MVSDPLEPRKQADEEAIQPSAPRTRARLGPVLLGGARLLWDRFGLFLAVSISWAFVVSLPLSGERWLPRGVHPAMHLLLLALIPLFAAVPTAGAFSLARRILRHEEATYAHMWLDGAEMLGPAVRLSLLQFGVGALLVISFLFYLRISVSIVGSIVTGYAILMWAMMACYHWPVLVSQEQGLFDDPERRARRGAYAAMRRSFYLALGAPFFTAGLLGSLLLLCLAMAATAVLPALAGVAVVSVITSVATEAVLVQFGVVPTPVVEEPVPDLQFKIKLPVKD